MPTHTHKNRIYSFFFFTCIKYMIEIAIKVAATSRAGPLLWMKTLSETHGIGCTQDKNTSTRATRSDARTGMTPRLIYSVGKIEGETSLSFKKPGLQQPWRRDCSISLTSSQKSSTQKKIHSITGLCPKRRRGRPFQNIPPLARYTFCVSCLSISLSLSRLRLRT